MTDFVDKMITAMRNNPEGVLLFGAGLALVLRKTTNIGGSSPAPKGKRSAAKPARKVVPQAVKDAAEDVRERATEYSDAVAKTAKRAYASTRSVTKDFAETSPFGVVFAGLAAGLIVAAALPTTEVEREALGPVARKAADLAGDATQDIKEAAVNAGTEALRAGLSAAVSIQEGADGR